MAGLPEAGCFTVAQGVRGNLGLAAQHMARAGRLSGPDAITELQAAMASLDREIKDRQVCTAGFREHAEADIVEGVDLLPPLVAVSVRLLTEQNGSPAVLVGLP